MLPITLPIFFNTDQTTSFKDMGMDYLLVDCEVRPMRFYRIDALSPYLDDDGRNYTTIHVGGENFVCQYKFTHTQNLIETDQV